jgi:hypothetical protein
LQKLSEAGNSAAKTGLQDTQKKMTDILGGPAGPPTSATPTITLSRVNDQAITLYQQIWQVDAEPTSSQMEALARVDRDHAAASKRWSEFKTTDLPVLNRMLHDANVPEIDLHMEGKYNETQGDEE